MKGITNFYGIRKKQSTTKSIKLNYCYIFIHKQVRAGATIQKSSPPNWAEHNNIDTVEVFPVQEAGASFEIAILSTTTKNK